MSAGGGPIALCYGTRPQVIKASVLRQWNPKQGDKESYHKQEQTTLKQAKHQPHPEDG